MVLLVDAVQTPAVRTDRRGASEKEMLWEGRFFEKAKERGELEVFALEHVYRTASPLLLGLAAALRAEDFERAKPLIVAAAAEIGGGTTHIVHDNEQIYPIADVVHNVAGAARVLARAELGGPGGPPSLWSSAARRALRKESKALVEVQYCSRW